MTTRKLLVIDTETGGLDPEQYSILSVGAVVWRDGNITDSTEILIKEAVLHVSPEALGINKIDLISIGEKGVAPIGAVAELEAFVRKNFDLTEPGARAVLAGHNVSFDVSFLKRLYRQAGAASYDDVFAHRTIDTAGILRFLTFTGLLPLSGAGSTEAFEYFGIEVSARHTALGDALATAQLIGKLIDVVQRGVPANAST